MTASLDQPPPGWACSWVSSLVEEEVRSFTRVRSKEANEVFQLGFDGNEGGKTLVHGDACLPNFLYRGDHLSGYIDIGDLTVGEMEVDLAAAVWSLQYNLGPGHGLAFLREYGLKDADEERVEALRLKYELG
jgi:aminoglycoside phosphotransferase